MARTSHVSQVLVFEHLCVNIATEEQILNVFVRVYEPETTEAEVQPLANCCHHFPPPVPHRQVFSAKYFSVMNLAQTLKRFVCQ